MWAIAGILAVGICLIMLEVPALLKKKRMRETIVFLVFLFISLSLSIYHSTDKEIPSPLHLVKFIYQPLKEIFFGT